MSGGTKLPTDTTHVSYPKCPNYSKCNKHMLNMRHAQIAITSTKTLLKVSGNKTAQLFITTKLDGLKRYLL